MNDMQVVKPADKSKSDAPSVKELLGSLEELISRSNHQNIHVRGYKEEGTTTTPFDMVVLNDLDRFNLVGDVIDRTPSLGALAAYAKQFIRDKLIDHKKYICEHGEDMPEIKNWKWQAG